MSRLVLVLWIAACGYTPQRIAPGDGGLDSPLDDVTPDGFVRRINLAGVAYTGIDFPGEWEGEAAASVCGPMFWPVTGGIKNTVDDPLFTTHVYGQPTLTCAIPNIPAGNYRITLLYGPTFYGPGCNTAVDQHFSIEIEGAMLDPDFNLTAATLGCVRELGTGNAAPVTRVFDVAVDGTLDIVETAPVGEAAMLSAIQIVEL